MTEYITQKRAVEIANTHAGRFVWAFEREKLTALCNAAIQDYIDSITEGVELSEPVGEIVWAGGVQNSITEFKRTNFGVALPSGTKLYLSAGTQPQPVNQQTQFGGCPSCGSPLCVARSCTRDAEKPVNQMLLEVLKEVSHHRIDTLEWQLKRQAAIAKAEAQQGDTK